ncbi:hypothetical protein QAD02_014196 [Eretmocerus hayati]|uniref:Uncharacterized protein n=1 Tax=Eretmocerus hayati TaxID=131215 RepID=A0ACC2P733_9HYME|nr:hypothetical protein QAD02_014196 [Eretmocerus hayati]
MPLKDVFDRGKPLIAIDLGPCHPPLLTQGGLDPPLLRNMSPTSLLQLTAPSARPPELMLPPMFPPKPLLGLQAKSLPELPPKLLPGFPTKPLPALPGLRPKLFPPVLLPPPHAALLLLVLSRLCISCPLWD